MRLTWIVSLVAGACAGPTPSTAGSSVAPEAPVVFADRSPGFVMNMPNPTGFATDLGSFTLVVSTPALRFSRFATRVPAPASSSLDLALGRPAPSAVPGMEFIVVRVTLTVDRLHQIGGFGTNIGIPGPAYSGADVDCILRDQLLRDSNANARGNDPGLYILLNQSLGLSPTEGERLRIGQAPLTATTALLYEVPPGVTSFTLMCHSSWAALISRAAEWAPPVNFAFGESQIRTWTPAVPYR